MPAPIDRRYLFFIAVLAGTIVLLHFAGPLTREQMKIKGVDPVCYYAYLRSAVLDHDLDFYNEYEQLRGERVFQRHLKTATGKVPNLFSAGPAIFWSPFFALGHLWALSAGLPADGYSYPYHMAVFAAEILYGFVGVLLCYRLCKKVFPENTAFLATLTVWFATPVICYLVLSPPMAHNVSLFCVSLFLLVWYEGRDKVDLKRWALLGALGGLMTLVRWQNSLFLILPVGDLVWSAVRRREENANLPRTGLHLGLLLGIVVVLFIPQMAVWNVLYGSPLTVPQGDAFVRWIPINLLNVLFSTRHGLYTWSPVVALCTIGFILLCFQDRKLGVPILLAFLLQVYINGSIAGDWWAGWAFGARRFINCTPLFVIGLAALMKSLRGRVPRGIVPIMLVALIVWNVLFIFQYKSGLIPQDNYLTYDQIVTNKFTILFVAIEMLFGVLFR